MARYDGRRLHLVHIAARRASMAVDLRYAQRTDPQRSATEAGLLYERYSGRILAYCLHALRDRGDAEDAVQTTFLHAHRALQRGVVPEYAFAWLHTIAKNVCRMQRRTAERRAAVTGLDLDMLPAPDGDAAEKELLSELDAALASLPERQRRAIVMRELRGLSSEEVASQMGMSATATYALLTRARRSLAQALAVGGRSALGLDLGLLLRLKALFAGGATKVATTTAVALVVAAGGVTLERALVEHPSGSRVPAERALEAEATTPLAAHVVHVPISATSPQPRDRLRAGEPTRGRVGTAHAPGQPDTPGVPSTPTALPSPSDPGTRAETQIGPIDPADSPGLGGDTADPVVETVSGLGLPEVDVDVVTEIVPDVPLPPVDVPTATDPVQAPPLPGLPPLP
jgi:RNA polymerase sigma-70 factor, ECF subfamily